MTSIELFILLIVIIIEFNDGYGVRLLVRFSQTIRSKRSCLGATSGTTVAGVTGSPGQWSYQLNSPMSINFDQNGYMYIMDSGNNRIQRWTLGASYGVTMVSATSLLGNGRGVNFNSFGELIVADYSNHRVVKFPVACCEYCSKSEMKRR